MTNDTSMTKAELEAIKARQLDWAKGEYALDSELINEDLPALWEEVERLDKVIDDVELIAMKTIHRVLGGLK